MYDSNPLVGGIQTWDDDEFRSYTGSWAVWPARGGPNGLDPQPGNANYLDLMDTWMIYRPIDMTNTDAIQLDFFLKYEIVDGDHLYFGYSTDGMNFILQERHGAQDWAWQMDLYDNLVGQSQVWFGWQFVSDNSCTWGGPWIDDIRLSIIPGKIYINGYFLYMDRLGQNRPAEGIKVQAFDQNAWGKDLLQETVTDINGYYNFQPIDNWDTDPFDSDKRLDIYVKWLTENGLSQVADLSGNHRVYQWDSVVYDNINPGLINIYQYIADDASRGAVWIYQDIIKTQYFYFTNTTPQDDTGYLTARWEFGQMMEGLCTGSCFWAAGDPHVFIDQSTVDSEDEVVHELGHHVMYNKTGQWLWNEPSCFNHQMFSIETTECAWYEGWADYFALAINENHCYDFYSGHCLGIADADYFDIEAHNRYDNRNKGDLVEARISGSLWDLMDGTNENYDSSSWGFAPLIDLGLVFPGVATLNEFWLTYNGPDKHNGIRSLWQNSIEYNHAPVVNQIADQFIFMNTIRNHLIDLYAFVEDLESNDDQLSYNLLYSSPNCHVTLDNHWINVSPTPEWSGYCFVELGISDSIESIMGSFNINVVPIYANYFVPLINK